MNQDTLNLVKCGLAIGAGIALVGWVVALEVRMRRVQGELFSAQEKLKDGEIENNTRSLSDVALDNAINQRLGRSADSTKPKP